MLGFSSFQWVWRISVAGRSIWERWGSYQGFYSMMWTNLKIQTVLWQSTQACPGNSLLSIFTVGLPLQFIIITILWTHMVNGKHILTSDTLADCLLTHPELCTYGIHSDTPSNKQIKRHIGEWNDRYDGEFEKIQKTMNSQKGKQLPWRCGAE